MREVIMEKTAEMMVRNPSPNLHAPLEDGGRHCRLRCRYVAITYGTTVRQALLSAL
jgi:hypothetical protein